MYSCKESSGRWLCISNGSSRPSTGCAAGSFTWPAGFYGCGFGWPYDRESRRQRSTGQMKKIAIVGFLLMLIACGAQSQEKAVRISVLGLFHPQEIVVFQTGVRPLI